MLDAEDRAACFISKLVRQPRCSKLGVQVTGYCISLGVRQLGQVVDNSFQIRISLKLFHVAYILGDEGFVMPEEASSYVFLRSEA